VNIDILSTAMIQVQVLVQKSKIPQVRSHYPSGLLVIDPVKEFAVGKTYDCDSVSPQRSPCCEAPDCG
jgi:hypothetical protein